MSTSVTYKIKPDDGWVEITAADGLEGLISNDGADCRYAETASAAPGGTISGTVIRRSEDFPKLSTKKAWVRCYIDEAAITFTEWEAPAA